MKIEFIKDYVGPKRGAADDNGSYIEQFHCPFNANGVYIRDVDCTPGFGEVDEGFLYHYPCIDNDCKCVTECHIGVIPIIECDNPCHVNRKD